MPFTFSHPAVVLPFWNSKKHQLSITGLIAGTMVPDFEFLFRLRETAIFGHTLPGIIFFDIPAAIILSYVFHLYIRNVLVLHLPKPIRQRFTSYLSFNWKWYFKRNLLWYFISVLIGLVTHFVLDDFTHSYGYIVNRVSFFTLHISIMHYDMPVYYILQLALSLIGAGYGCWFISRMGKGRDVNVVKRVWEYWLSLTVLWLLFFALRLFVYPQYHSTEDIIIAFTGCFVYALLMVSVYFTRYAKKRKRAL